MKRNINDLSGLLGFLGGGRYVIVALFWGKNEIERGEYAASYSMYKRIGELGGMP